MSMIRKLNFFLIVLMLATVTFVGCAAATPDTSANDHVIQVSGSGTVTGTPDRVQLSFAVETESPDVKSAQTDNANRMSAMVDALVAAGVPKDQMQTTGYSIYPVYQDSTGLLDQKIKTYQVTNTLQVTLKDVTQTGGIIDTAVAAGANKVTSIQFMLSDEQALSLRTAALQKAVVNARSDADAVAGALEVNITGTQSADISQGYMPVAYDYTTLSGNAMKSSDLPTPIQPGDITVTAQVSVIYSIS